MIVKEKCLLDKDIGEMYPYVNDGDECKYCFAHDNTAT